MITAKKASVIEGNDKVAGIVRAEQSYVDLLFVYANWPEGGGVVWTPRL